MSTTGRNVSAIEEAGKRFDEAMKKYSPDIYTGIGIVMTNIPNGCSWGFISGANREFEKSLHIFENSDKVVVKALGQDSKGVGKGWLVNIPMDLTLKILDAEAKGLISSEDLENAKKHRQDAILSLDKFMKKGKEGRIGIFSTNDTKNITVNGKTYPAFTVTLDDLLALCVRNNYKLNLGAPRTPAEVNNVKDAVLSKLMLAPSGNALLIDICK